MLPRQVLQTVQLLKQLPQHTFESYRRCGRDLRLRRESQRPASFDRRIHRSFALLCRFLLGRRWQVRRADLTTTVRLITLLALRRFDGVALTLCESCSLHHVATSVWKFQHTKGLQGVPLVVHGQIFVLQETPRCHVFAAGTGGQAVVVPCLFLAGHGPFEDIRASQPLPGVMCHAQGWGLFVVRLVGLMSFMSRFNQGRSGLCLAVCGRCDRWLSGRCSSRSRKFLLLLALGAANLRIQRHMLGRQAQIVAGAHRFRHRLIQGIPRESREPLGGRPATHGAARATADVQDAGVPAAVNVQDIRKSHGQKWCIVQQNKRHEGSRKAMPTLLQAMSSSAQKSD
mmetsp:Transcript_19313/g.42648  ORF Transcript_19313/g.42648 Transcript_19313/m.42648 type:complete len:342 (-) Transcript_19313:516-1541(-)